MVSVYNIERGSTNEVCGRKSNRIVFSLAEHGMLVKFYTIPVVRNMLFMYT